MILTKGGLVLRLREATGLIQTQVFDVVQKTRAPVATALAVLNRQCAQRFFYLRDQDFALATGAGLGSLGDDFHCLLQDFVRHDQIKFDHRQKVHGVFLGAIGFFMPVLAAKSFHFTDGHVINANILQGILDFIQFGKLNNGFDLFHRFHF